MIRAMSVTKSPPTTTWWKRLRTDESGAVNAASYLLLATIVGIGMIVGLVVVRNQIVQELGDIAVALESLDQSYSFTIGTQTVRFRDKPTDLRDPRGREPAGISVQEEAREERPQGRRRRNRNN